MKKSLLYFLAFMLCLLVAKPAMAKAADQNSNAVIAAVIFDSKWPNIDELGSAGVSNKSDYHLLTTVAVSVPPTLTTSGGNTSFVSGDNTASTPVAVDAGITVADVSRATLASATVAITGNFVSGEDVLSFINNGSTMGNITASSFDNVAGMFTLTSLGATATLAQWQSALQSITYTNTAVSPNTAARTISFIVDDGIATSNTATKMVAITATNQTPIVTTTGGTTANYVTGASATTIDGGITVNDGNNTTQVFGRIIIATGFNTGDVLTFTNTSSALFGNVASRTSSTGTLTLLSSPATTTNAQWANVLSAITFSSSSTPAGNRTISFMVNDGTKTSATVTDVVAVSVPPTITLSPTTLPDLRQGVPYSQTIAASGGTASYHYAVTSGTLPGLSLNSTTGVISGTSIATVGTYNFTITATDNGGFTGSQAYTLNVVPNVTVTGTVNPATVGVLYNAFFFAANGTAPDTFSITSGALPAGLTLSSFTGEIIGTATEGGTFNFTVTATDANLFTGSSNYTLTVNPPTISIANPTANPSATAAYNNAITASGGTAPYSYVVTGGALPAGISLASDGTLSGQATALGAFSYTVTVTDASTGTGPYTQIKTIAGTVVQPTITVSPTLALLPKPKAGVFYSQTFTAIGGSGTYTFTQSSGTLPSGLTLAADGTLSGTPTAVGISSFVITATDNSPGLGPFTGTRSYNPFVTSAPTIVVGPATVPDGTAGAAYSQNITASGGTAPYAYTITSGALPSGLTFASDGTLSGTTSVTGTFTFTVTATDVTTGAGAPYGGSGSISVTFVAPTITLTTTLSAPTLGVAYSQNVSASGGAAPYTYAVTAGALPAGLTLSASTGAISGTPITTGTFNFTVSATDVNSFTGSQAYTQTINAPSIVLAPATLPTATVGTAYSQAITASGGTAPYTYVVTAGAIPAGLTLASDGTLSGTPTDVGNYFFLMHATDNSPSPGPYISATKLYNVPVSGPTIVVSPATLPGGTAGVAYSQNITATGGTAPYTYTITAGALPAGVTLSSAGVLSGTSTVTGTFNFTVNATDVTTGVGAPYGGSGNISVTFVAPAITLTTTLSAPTVGVAYSQTVNTSGGTGPYTYAVTTGTLPAGLTLSAATGTISGTPTSAGTFNFTVTATDVNSFTGSQAYTQTINAPSIVLAPSTLLAGTVSTAYSQAITASGGTGPYSYAVTAGALPAGLTLAANGAISGTPTSGGSFNFTITSTDAGSFTGSQPYALTISAPSITLAPATLPAGAFAAAYSQALTASGGTGPYAYTITAGALPAGLTLAANGTISGTPTAGGTFNFTVTATDASSGTGPYTGSNAYSITIGHISQTITFADITATYGDAPVALTATSSSGLPVAYSSSNTAVATVSGNTLTILAAGSATITASQPGNSNYDAAADAAKTLTVNKKAITITAASQTKVYGTADPVLTYQVTSGAVAGTDAFTGSLTRNAGETVNTYAIQQGTLTLGNNYIVTYSGADLTISKAALTATADDQTRAYGAADPAFTISYTGFVNGDSGASLTTRPTVSTTATTGSAVGTYPLTIAGAVSPNYTITYVAGTLTITKPVLTVTADNKSRNYGAQNPEFTVTYSGFLNGDDASKLTTAPVSVNNTIATTMPGNYPITVSGGASADYTFNYVPGTLTIVPLINADLISLTTSSGSLSPQFDAGTFTYNVTVDNVIADLKLTATFDITASATVNDMATPNGSPSSGVPLSVGNNLFTLTVTAQDGVTKKTYSINVYRGIAPTSITSNNILTPNGDGKNDFWVVKDIQLYPNNRVTVYDSGGRSVFSKRGYNNDWGGTLNETGVPLAGGTYFYTVDLGIGQNVIKGYISIIRSN